MTMYWLITLAFNTAAGVHDHGAVNLAFISIYHGKFMVQFG